MGNLFKIFLLFLLASCTSEKETLSDGTLFLDKKQIVEQTDSLFLASRFPSFLQITSAGTEQFNEHEVLEKLKFLEKSGLPNEFSFDKWKQNKSKDSIINLFVKYRSDIKGHKWENIFDHYAGYLLLAKLDLLNDYYNNKSEFKTNYSIKGHAVRLINSQYTNYILLYSCLAILNKKNDLTDQELADLKQAIIKSHNYYASIQKSIVSKQENDKRELLNNVARIAIQNKHINELFYNKIFNEF